jgi:V/A-type H+/Na+-transporting ATPase subunit I
MKIVSIIGKLSDLDKISRLIVMNGDTHILNALSELNSNNLNLSASQEHMQALQELAHLRPYIARRDFSKDEVMIKAFQELFSLKPEIYETHLSIGDDYENITSDLRKVYDSVSNISGGIGEKAANIEKLQRYLENVGYLRNTSLRIEELKNMSFIRFRLLMLSNDSYKKLELNIENIPSVVFRVAAMDGNIVIAALTPQDLGEEAERIFASLNYKELELPDGYSGNAVDTAKQLQKEIDKEKRLVEELKASVLELREKYKTAVDKAYTLLELEKKAEKVKQDAALGHNMFFIFGFVPDSEIDSVRTEIQQNFNDSVVLMADNVEDRRRGHAPPTKIRNNILIRPFETLISMYGTPSYGEKDPTPFFAISYMLLFGAMFGDLGQGLIILLGGLLLSYKTKNKSFGGILSRLGASSMLFGALYGSIFGSEELIEPLLIRPMANINTMLVAAIVFGMILITISYIYSLFNHYSSRNVEEGLFGREGLTGFLFFLTLVYTVWGKATGHLTVAIGLPIGIMAALLLVMVFKQPLAGLLTGHRLYEDSPGDYYIEAGFGVIETVLSVASNIISFIRVGAFALNHVGLYIAFSTMAEMMNSKVGGIIVLIIGNIIIIGLEGLIVFIQSLRLEYYELFSKYYSGYGVEYRPIGLFNEVNADS